MFAGDRDVHPSVRPARSNASAIALGSRPRFAPQRAAKLAADGGVPFPYGVGRSMFLNGFSQVE